MTLKEFRERTKNMDEEAILVIDGSNESPWYLGEEIKAAVENLGERGALKYLFDHGVTLSEIQYYGGERLHILAKYMQMFENEETGA